jgi:hypothetical protein
MGFIIILIILIKAKIPAAEGGLMQLDLLLIKVNGPKALLL